MGFGAAPNVATLILAPRARRDLREIGIYIGERNPRAADRLVDGMFELCQTLAEQPFMGRRRPELSDAGNIRSLPHGSYVVYYLPAPDGVQILRVLHGARDVTPSHFLEDSEA